MFVSKLYTSLALLSASSVLAAPASDISLNPSVGLVSRDDADLSIISAPPEFFEVDDAVMIQQKVVDATISTLESVADLPDNPDPLIRLDQGNSLSLHNLARKIVKNGPLIWDSALEAAALVYAKQLASTGNFAHSPSSSRPGQGENLAYFFSTDPINNPMTQATKAWLAEKKYYMGQNIPEGDFAAYGHYTQCTWGPTTKVGVASASNGQGTIYTVARYTSAGNYVGQKPYPR
jgi:hypothetical protein